MFILQGAILLLTDVIWKWSKKWRLCKVSPVPHTFVYTKAQLCEMMETKTFSIGNINILIAEIKNTSNRGGRGK